MSAHSEVSSHSGKNNLSSTSAFDSIVGQATSDSLSSEAYEKMHVSLDKSTPLKSTDPKTTNVVGHSQQPHTYGASGADVRLRNLSDNTTAMASDSESTNPYHSDEETYHEEGEEGIEVPYAAASSVATTTPLSEVDSNATESKPSSPERPQHEETDASSEPIISSNRSTQDSSSMATPIISNPPGSPRRGMIKPGSIPRRYRTASEDSQSAAGPSSPARAEQAPLSSSVSNKSTSQIGPSPRNERVVRSYSQKPVNASQQTPQQMPTTPDSSSGNTVMAEVLPEKKGRTRPSSAPRTSKGGVFGRSTTPRPPTSPTDFRKPTMGLRRPSLRDSNTNDDKPASRRSWLGSFRGKPVTGKPEALVVVAPDGTASGGGARSLSRGSRSRIENAAEQSESESDVSNLSKQSKPWTPRTVSGPETKAAPEQLFAVKKLVQSLTKDHTAEVNSESADQALRELRSLQTELSTLRAQGNAKQTETERMQMELGAAQKAAAQLESLNKSYRKNQKQMLKDLQDAQAELESYRESNDTAASSSSKEAQHLAEELATTMAELLALREEHKKLLGGKKRPRAASLTNRSDGEALHLSRSSSEEEEALLQQETMLNLQKDLAEAMATISILEENNDIIRKQLKKRDKLEERFKRVQADRDEYAAQLRDQQLAQHAREGGDVQDRAALVTIERLQKEKKQLLVKEHMLKEKIQKLDTKNKNQKAIFQTAVEIKDVEMKINRKERDILAHRLVEIKKDGENSARGEPRSSLARSQPEGASSEREQQMAQQLETKQSEITSLEKMLKEQERESDIRMEEAVADFKRQIAELDEKIKKKEREMGELQDCARLEAFKARRLMDEKVGELQVQLDEYEDRLINREQQIKQLDEQMRVRQAEIERIRTVQQQQQQQRRPSDRPQQGGRSERLSELRNRLDKNESLMRSKVQNIRNFDSPSKSTIASLNDSFSSQERADTSMLDLSSCPDDATIDKLREMEAALQKGQSKITELQGELATVRTNLDKANSDLVEEQERRRTEVQEAEQTSQKRIEELSKSLMEREAHARNLQMELDDTKSQLVQARSSLAEQIAESSMLSKQEDSHKAENTALRNNLTDRENLCNELKQKVDALETEVATAYESRLSAENELRDAQAKFERMEAQLIRESKEVMAKNKVSEGSAVGEERIQSLEQELASTAAKLAEAESKCEMLEQFIHEDTSSNLHLGSTKDELVDVVSLKEALREKEQEVERFRQAAEASADQLAQARRNVEELETERALSQAKVSQLSATLEKRGDGEQKLYQKTMEAAEATAAQTELKDKLNEANAVIKRLQAELESNQGPEDRSVSSNTQLSVRLAETEVKIDMLRAKLSIAERTARELRQQNERLSMASNRDGAPEDVMNKMKFLEEQNAAYAASLKALRIEIATRHEGTAFE